MSSVLDELLSKAFDHRISCRYLRHISLYRSHGGRYTRRIAEMKYLFHNSILSCWRCLLVSRALMNTTYRAMPTKRDEATRQWGAFGDDIDDWRPSSSYRSFNALRAMLFWWHTSVVCGHDSVSHLFLCLSCRMPMPGQLRHCWAPWRCR